MDTKMREFMKFGFTDMSGNPESLELGWKHLFSVLWREIFTLIKANICFILFSIPCVTIPAALTALFSICVDAIRGKPVKVGAVYWKTLRTMFFPSLGAFAALSGMAALGFYGTVFYGRWLPGLLRLLILLPSSVAVIALLMFPYCFSMLACVALPWHKVLKNSFLLVFLNLKFSICCGVLASALLLLQMQFWIRAVPLILTCGISITVYIAAYFALFGIQSFVLTQKL